MLLALLALLVPAQSLAESPVPPAEVYGPAILPDHTHLVSSAAPVVAFVLAMDEYGQVLQGSGVVVRADGWVATSYEMVAWTDTFEVQLELPDGHATYEARLARVYPELGLALLRVPASQLPTLPPAPAESLLSGTRIVSLGYPTYNQLERGLRLSRGSLSAPLWADGTASQTLLRGELLYVSGLAGAAVCTPDAQLVGLIVGPEPGSASTVQILPMADVLERIEAVAAQDILEAVGP